MRGKDNYEHVRSGMERKRSAHAEGLRFDICSIYGGWKQPPLW